MNKLETLLNTLIQQGWKPFGKKYTHLNYDPKRKYRHIMFGGVDLAVFSYSLRQLVSLESGLWQFVCSHLLIGPNKNDRSKNSDIGEDGYLTGDQYYQALNYQFRLIESALVPEEELGKFLIDNIK